MKFWLIKSASTLEDEAAILEHNVINLGWSEFSDFSEVKSVDQVKEIMLEKYPTMMEERCETWAQEIYSFVREIRLGDFVAVPLKARKEVLFGKVRGEYEYRQVSNFINHVRKVRWLRLISKGDFEAEYGVDLNGEAALFEIPAKPEKIAGIVNTKSAETLLTELSFGLEDLAFLREQLEGLVEKLKEAEELSEVRKIALEMEKMLKKL
ncbi:MAG: hypothetical protein PHD26_08710 [Methanosarcinaceae archaeon]|nr:hypothetical protein [Methanosarcinaceae archaeon]